MTNTSHKPKSPFWDFLNRHFRKILWIVGVLTSAIQPFMKSPLGASHSFFLGALFSGVFGFALMEAIVHTQRIAIVIKWIIAFVFLVLLIVSLNKYDDLLNSVENTTPSGSTLNIEEFWFCLFYLSVLALLAFVFDKGGRYLISLFSPKASP